MSLTHKYSLSIAAVSLTGFASNATEATWPLTATAATDGLAHKVSIKNDSATDHSDKTAVLTGTDADGREQTETVTLPGASATIESLYYYKTLTSVEPSDTIGEGTMDIGWVDEVASKSIMLNRHSFSEAMVQVDVTGTLNYTIQVTIAAREEWDNQKAAPWISTRTSQLVGATADAVGMIEVQAVAARLVVSSYSSTPTAVVYVSEAAIER